MILKNKYDAIVIGAGPAGSSFAFHASRSGLRVLLVEKQREIGHTILCAEGVSSEFLKLIKDKGHSRNFVARYVYGGILTYNGEKILDVSVNEPLGAVLERKIFDRYLAELAIKAGSDILINTKFIKAEREKGLVKVYLRSHGEDIVLSAPLLIGADGPASSVSKSLGLFTPYDKEDDYFTVQVYAYCDEIKDNYLYFGIGDAIAPNGYAWIFPKGGGFANVGVGIPGTRDGLDTYLKNFLKKHCSTYKILGETYGVVPTKFHKRPIYGNNVLILGDAARLADPLTGGGIANAYISGIAASEVASFAKKMGDYSRKALRLYEKKLKKWIFSDYMITLCAKIFYNALEKKELESFMYSLKDAIGHIEITPPLKPMSMLFRILRKDPAFLFKFGKKGLYAAKECLREFI